MRSGRVMGAHFGARSIFIVIALITTWVGAEFPAFGGTPLWYQRTVMGVPLHYPLFGFLIILLSPYIFRAPHLNLTAKLKSTQLWRPVALIWLTLMVAIALGMWRGASELFTDWRNWLIIAVVVWLASRWLNAQPWKTFALTDLAIGYGLMCVALLIIWAAGGGTIFYDVRVPLWYGYNLMLAGFAALVATDTWLTGLTRFGPMYRLALRITAVAGSLIVLMSFRRSFWLLLVTGMIVVGIRAIRTRRLGGVRWFQLTVMGSLIVIAVISSLGVESISGRVASILPTADNEYSNTNTDHLNDIVDALEVVAQEPLFGLGIGDHYQTQRITDWKTESFEVHSAPVHVWLKFGLLGLVTYLLFHYRLIRALFRFDSQEFVGLGAAGAYLIGEQVQSLVQTWPYTSFQISIHHGLVLAILLLAAEPTRQQQTVGAELAMNAG